MIRRALLQFCDGPGGNRKMKPLQPVVGTLIHDVFSPKPSKRPLNLLMNVPKHKPPTGRITWLIGPFILYANRGKERVGYTSCKMSGRHPRNKTPGAGLRP